MPELEIVEGQNATMQDFFPDDAACQAYWDAFMDHLTPLVERQQAARQASEAEAKLRWLN